MSSEKENFDLSGPLHLTCVDWTNVDHRRSVAACLVQGVYILERDRQDNRQGSQALAPSWWEFFQFRLHTRLVDDADHSIFGAIYEFIPASNCNHLKNGSPHFVIAFRGTLTKGEAFVRDFQLDVHVIRNGLHQTSRFEIAMQAVRNTVAEFGNLNNIWLAGHSLGASMAMLAGKTMAKTGVLLEAFLFNPPFFSAPIERIKDKKVKLGIRIAGSFLAAGLAVALKGSPPAEESNRRSVCSFVRVGPVSVCTSGRSHLLGVFRNQKIRCILIPSANLVVNLVPAQDFKQAHGIHQWWRPDLNLQSKVYNYR
ncbi:UDP-D-glucose/UDP-D-galactose 4-epimerase 5 [Actinidia rufa]|uniref:UDP-D-glucose/UDP-D-galactose 4-epimerase 5 n=1 Tax=Actinidia rufa TaxID=165716 RepID=A0A7J0GZY7_9ERIC|nr:UDP-D-glucose/UDP-D-galactose 4-epimerase 5 [Actinidia rufa]